MAFSQLVLGSEHIDDGGYRLLVTCEGRLQERTHRLQGANEDEAKAEAAAIVERREVDGTWPEGCDAVLLGPRPEVRMWTYTDGWEEMVDGG